MAGKVDEPFDKLRASGMPNVLRVERLCKSYRRRQVLKDVSFDVAPGEIVGLLGPNGAGKSTSFNIIAGLIAADSGSVFLGERCLDGLPLYRRARAGLGYLSQEASVFRGLTVLDNLIAVIEMQERKGDPKQRAEKILADYALENVANNLGSELSGGERRRVEMARALVPAPAVVLLDEPFAGIDPIAVSELKKFIVAMRQDGIAVLVTDHNVRETLAICDRAYLIAAGVIVLSGKPEDIVDDEQARRTYLGTDFRL